MPSSGPSGFGRNAYYKTQEEYLFAVADAMHEEYQGIVDAGLILQVDDPYLIDMLGDPAVDPAERARQADVHIAALNHALEGIPEDKVRHHTCYGLNHGPRLTDIELRDEYICNYASIVGKENVIAGTDCGFSSRASYAPEVHPTVVWPKFKALAEGAKIATQRLWG